ncbi:tRNA (adenosine(37)-N6)-threonylcarbamoyltransferase complex dimerization subunit type 1 TsaB [Thermogemmatispora onikobensis]|uniref:tRNA (adenosine(37)-N6)-threonylcarbamoyltransferase complex dimerization subunit type 1 TsaB n=1 Tax=Thermogemmatispora onikobensis TaxID=732234 RepID=UPI0008535D49|nr:tRNA (adenosine(37)-N6)-threonylcarbamoyltransferase complex dimerization subunit type 1 TsaB [Thermogemmatispora onikobensis]
MLLLAIDSSTRQASLALCSEETLYAEETWLVENNHSVELLPAIRRLLSSRNWRPADLSALAVALGPGSFNGVRVAVATARSLAFALEKPLVGVGTLDIIAAQQRRWSGPICAVLEAGRSELYAACYLSTEGQDEQGRLTQDLQRLGDYVLLPPQQLVAYLKELAATSLAVPGRRELPPFLFCGELKAATCATLRSSLPECAFAEPLLATRRATTLAALAWPRLLRGEGDDPLRLEPLYLRPPAITASARKQPLLNAVDQPRSLPQSETEREERALHH